MPFLFPYIRNSAVHPLHELFCSALMGGVDAPWELLMQSPWSSFKPTWEIASKAFVENLVLRAGICSPPWVSCRVRTRHVDQMSRACHWSHFSPRSTFQVTLYMSRAQDTSSVEGMSISPFSRACRQSCKFPGDRVQSTNENCIITRRRLLLRRLNFASNAVFFLLTCNIY